MRRIAVLFVLALLPALVGADNHLVLVPEDPAFEQVWAQSDGPVAAGEVSRSWMWGPHPIGVGRDYYMESTAPGGLRLVQYWDKARMEITYPDADPEGGWYVTNGLLVKEMVTGQRQQGDSSFFPEVSSPSFAAPVPVAGDLDSRTSPTYSSFYSLFGSVPDRTGETVLEWVDKAGDVTRSDVPEEIGYVSFQETTGHNIPQVFWDYMNDPASGLSDNPTGSWLFAMGYPITEAYWTRVQVGGVEKDVLVQLYERRVLTYTPVNDPAWRVEMGNVGLAYMRWAKPNVKFNPKISLDGTQVAYEGQVWGNRDIYVVNTDGTDVRQVSRSPYDERAPQWIDSGKLVYNGFDQGLYRAWEADLDAVGTPTYPRDWVYPTPSPNGTMVAYGSEGGALKVSSLDGSMDVLVPNGSRTYLNVVWSGDSSTIAFIAYDDSMVPYVETLYVWRVGDMESTAISGSSGNLRSFTLSPDGSQVAVSTSEFKLYVGQVGGGSIDHVPIVVSGLTASPVTPTLYYTGEDRGIWSVEFDGSAATKLTDPLISDTQVGVSSQGDKLVFRRTTLGNDQLVLLDLATMQEHVVVD